MFILSLLLRFLLVIEPTSLEKCDEALKHLTTTSLRDVEKRTLLCERVEILASMGRFDEAIPLMQKVIVTCSSPLEKTRLHTKLGHIYCLKGDVKKALHLLSKNLLFQQEHDDSSYYFEQMLTLEEIARCHVSLSQYEEALAPAMEAKNIASRTLRGSTREELRELLGHIHQKLSEFYLDVS